jgi:hypothetical protein
VTSNGEQEIVEALKSLTRAIIGSEEEGNKGLLVRVKNLERNQWVLIASLFAGAGTGQVVGRLWF